MEPIYVGKRKLAKLVDYHPDSLKYIKRKSWVEGIHFIRPNKTTVRYHLKNCLDWFVKNNHSDSK